MDPGVIFCRVLLNRQSADAHLEVFQAIDSIVYEDTGRYIRWRHLHALSLEDFEGTVLSVATDLHRGQAKGVSIRNSFIIMILIGERTWALFTAAR